MDVHELTGAHGTEHLLESTPPSGGPGATVHCPQHPRICRPVEVRAELHVWVRQQGRTLLWVNAVTLDAKGARTMLPARGPGHLWAP